MDEALLRRATRRSHAAQRRAADEEALLALEDRLRVNSAFGSLQEVVRVDPQIMLVRIKRLEIQLSIFQTDPSWFRVNSAFGSL